MMRLNRKCEYQVSECVGMLHCRQCRGSTCIHVHTYSTEFCGVFAIYSLEITPTHSQCSQNSACTLCHTMPYNTTPHHTVPHHAKQYHTTPHHTMPYNTTLHHTIPHHAKQYHTTPYHIVLHHAILHHNALYLHSLIQSWAELVC
jgi:hypothetical protein